MNTRLRQRAMRRLGIFLCVVLTPVVLVAAGLFAHNWVGASSHREAPLISMDAFADNTDTYAFIPGGHTQEIVLAASWIPFEGPEGGPNYWFWNDDVLYDIYVDNDGDAVADFTYTLDSRTELGNPDTFLYNTSTIDSPSDPDWNRRQYYTLTETTEAGVTTVLVADQLAAPSNIGDKSTPNYKALADATIYTYPVSEGTIKIFAGQTDDPFFVDLQVFDLLTLRGQAPPIGYSNNNRPVDSVSGFNVHSIVLEVPIDHLVDVDPVLGVWSASRRPTMTVLGADGSRTTSTDYVQVSRLGMPLVNEVVLPLGLKDTFNAIPPSVDATVYSLLQESVEDPEIGNLLCALYAVPLPGDTDDDCDTEYTAGELRSGRGDIFDVFLQGMVLASEFTINTADGPLTLPAGFNVNRPTTVTPAEMIRVNTAISGSLCAPTPSTLGVLGGDACGFPNGRRFRDDVVDIELLAVAGAAYSVLDGRDTGFVYSDLSTVLTDRVSKNDRNFLAVFPYIAYAQAGQSHRHQNQSGAAMPADGATIQASAPSAPANLYGFTVSMTGAPWLEIAAVVAPATIGLFIWLRRRHS